MALDRRIIAIFCISFLGIIIIRASVFRNSPVILVDIFSAEVVSTRLDSNHISGRGSMMLVNYEYYLVLNSTKCDREIMFDKDLYSLFVGRTGFVVIEKYHRTSLDQYEYKIISWTVNN